MKSKKKKKCWKRGKTGRKSETEFWAKINVFNLVLSVRFTVHKVTFVHWRTKLYWNIYEALYYIEKHLSNVSWYFHVFFSTSFLFFILYFYIPTYYLLGKQMKRDNVKFIDSKLHLMRVDWKFLFTNTFKLWALWQENDEITCYLSFEKVDRLCGSIWKIIWLSTPYLFLGCILPQPKYWSLQFSGLEMFFWSPLWVCEWLNL